MKIENMKNYTDYNDWIVRSEIENMKNYTDYNDWLDSNYLSSDYTDEEINDLYEMCKKNKSFDDKDESNEDCLEAMLVS